MKLKNLKTGKRILLGFSSITLLLLFVSGNAWLEMSKIAKNMDVSIVELKKLSEIKDINIIIDNIYLEMWGLVTARDRAEKQSRKTICIGKRAEYANLMDALTASAETPQEKDLNGALDKAVAGSTEINNRVIELAQATELENPQALELFERDSVNFMRTNIDPAIQAIISYREEQVMKADRAATDTFVLARIILAFGAFTALALSVILGFLITGSIVSPLKTVLTHTALLAKGDFSKNLPEGILGRRDEIGELSQAWDFMRRNIRTLLSSIKSETEILAANGESLSADMTKTAASMNRITSTTAGMKDQTINQAASVTETHATLEEIQSHLGLLNDLIENQAASVVESSSSNEEMVANIKSVVGILQKNFASMEALNGASEDGKDGIQEVTAIVTDIEKDSDGLLEAVSVIQGIASQTNLLAMNAAIEAAHAGASGKGFAVVADEIRKLAENSAEEAHKISAVLGSLKTRITTASLSSAKTMDQFVLILSLLGEVRNQETVIKNAMEEQDIGSAQVLEAIREINGITTRVKDGSSQMMNGSREVLVEMKALAEITEEMNQRMVEIAAGTDQVNEAIRSANEITVNTQGSILRVSAEVEKFKL